MYLILSVYFDFCKSGAGSRYLFAAPNSSYRLLPLFQTSHMANGGNLPAHGLLGLGLGINQTFYSSDLIVNRKQELTLLTYLVPAKGISTFPMEGIATRQSPSYEPPCSRSLCSLTIQTTRRYSLLASYRFVMGLGTSHMENSCHTILFDLSLIAFRGINLFLRKEIRFSVSLGIVNSHEGLLPLLSLSSFFLFERQSTTQSGRQSGFVLQVLASVNLLGELQPALFSLSFPSLKSSQPQLLNYVQLCPYGFFVDATLLPSTGHPDQLRHDVCRARPLPRRSQQSDSWN